MASKARPSLLLHHPGRTFARSLNKAQQIAIDMRHDMTAYEYKPETISKLDPGPAYPQKAVDDNYWKEKKKTSAKASLERLRTAAILKKQNERRYTEGRNFAHLKLDQIKREIQFVRDTESGKFSTKRIKVRNPLVYPKPEIDDSMQLPFDSGFDFIIKENAELID